QSLSDPFRFGVDVAEEKLTLMPLEELNALHDLFLCFLTESGKMDKTVFPARIFELANIRNSKLIVEDFDLFRPQIGNTHKFEKRFRNLLRQLLVIFHFSR